MQLKAVIFNKILSMKNHVIEMVRMTGGRESTERVFFFCPDNSYSFEVGIFFFHKTVVQYIWHVHTPFDFWYIFQKMPTAEENNFHILNVPLIWCFFVRISPPEVLTLVKGFFFRRSFEHILEMCITWILNSNSVIIFIKYAI